MTRQTPKRWNQTDLALLIGLHALRKGFPYIGARLNCTAGEARGMMNAASDLLRMGLSAERLIAPREKNPIDETDTIDPTAGRMRLYRVSPHYDQIHAASSGDVTARLMGDPCGDNSTSKQALRDL